MLKRLIVILSLLVAPAAAAAAERPDEGGLHHEAWFAASFLVLAEDLADAAAAGKRLALVWEQKGCPYCKQMHDVHLADPEFSSWVAERFHVVQLDFLGDRMVTDFDGSVLREKDLAQKYRVTATPTIQFLPDDPKALVGASAVPDVESARMPGLLPEPAFRAMFRYVYDKAYVTHPSFPAYLKTLAAE
ncbi:thioredoxin family protein [Novispirillum sp. DQ9]|uniref:thioredoxin family protein n=1 Tax=Novispirillum sp. DQ9 TaxID=3398612 RepID=UPI003C7C12B8